MVKHIRAVVQLSTKINSLIPEAEACSIGQAVENH
jgi:hypothetical protein